VEPSGAAPWWHGTCTPGGMKNLTEKVLQYQKTREGLRDIVNEIGPRIYQFPRRTMGWDEDACGEFYVFVHPRLIRLLDRFRDQGKPFESYLWAVLSWQLRNFARDRNREERRWKVSLRVEPGAAVGIDDHGCEEDEPEAEALQASAAIARCVVSAADRRNFLFLALKCSRLINAENAPALARVAGITTAALMTLIAALRDVREARENRHEMFRCRRNKAYAAIRLLETELAGEVEPANRQSLEDALGRMRRRMSAAMQRMSRVGLAPTNLEISRALGVPKGTVDSGLYWLKRKLGSVYDPDNLRSA
jgi:DNA-directed RNA polymerase specialized sigma24 family protein